ncbi:MAG: alpha-amylase, partial [Pseudomonadales bacterium]
MNTALPLLEQRLAQHLELIYAKLLSAEEQALLAQQLIAAMRLADVESEPARHTNLWSERDVYLITYADSVLSSGEKPLLTLKRFIDRHFRSFVSSLHILPFFPSSSDDGFA